ncbi:hypothetical protein KPSA3_04540 [Pseudomonas syringae pv. actinidiae]|uniref:Uncharacterized protein n=1 Tax=Pseudomonas syringae pv. actinidiae TaxID=103796 RepID=A0AAN4Q786_PSESF|nr:hypothetical protein KPSA3_04540 [Pseudomonas syringae pv. actinidiae]
MVFSYWLEKTYRVSMGSDACRACQFRWRAISVSFASMYILRRQHCVRMRVLLFSSAPWLVVFGR